MNLPLRQKSGESEEAGVHEPIFEAGLAKFHFLPTLGWLCWGMGRSGLSVGMKGDLGGDSQEKPVSPGLEKGEEAEQG